ncbi:hypothetical protein ILUMI_26531 [Ignelater luminosus]|uniref:BTB domain-containing protein n=1 Tax=Ignelater luminosus TaxID=2038154 RepID=A0A8K0C6H0_IGNLU|nr:hypothetical protein ILUMI_26531 [Ignelater luminosus]
MATTSSVRQDWQVLTGNLKSRGKYLLESGVWSDCRFVVGPEENTFAAHMLLLATTSPVFETMFYGKMPEKGEVVITDISPGIFKMLLTYIYTDEINVKTFDQAFELYYAAKKYMMLHLQKECMKYIESGLSPKNVCKAYELAKLYEESDLIEKCLNMIKDDTNTILKEKSFNEVNIDTLLTIFGLNELNIISENELFAALSRYVIHYNNGKGKNILDGDHPYVKEAIQKIRFLTLSPRQFTEGPATSNLLNTSEKLALLMKISSPASHIGIPSQFATSTCRRTQRPCKYDICRDPTYNSRYIVQDVKKNKADHKIPETGTR